MVQGQNILIFIGPGTEHIDFLWSGVREYGKYSFFVVWGQKILTWSPPGAVLGGEVQGAPKKERGILDP